MKIAVCISGLPRFWEHAYTNYIKPNLLDVYDCDVFIHSWYSKHDGFEWNKLIDTYNPKSIRIDLDGQIKMKRQNYNGASQRYPAYNIFSFYKSIMLANNLQTNYETNYDWVVRLRFDYALNTKFDFSSLDNTKLYVPNDRCNLEHTIMVDQFAFSSKDNMYLYSNVYPWIEHYYDTGTPMVGEHMLERQLKQYSLVGNKVVYLDMNHPFGTETGDSMRHSLIRRI